MVEMLRMPVPIDAADLYRRFGGARLDVLFPSDGGARFVPLRVVLANGDGSAKHTTILLRARSGEMVSHHAWDPVHLRVLASFVEQDPMLPSLIEGFSAAIGKSRPLSPALVVGSSRPRSPRVEAVGRWADAFLEFEVVVVDELSMTLPGTGLLPPRFAGAPGSEECLVVPLPSGVLGLRAVREKVADAIMDAVGARSVASGWSRWISTRSDKGRRSLWDVFERPERIVPALDETIVDWD